MSYGHISSCFILTVFPNTLTVTYLQWEVAADCLSILRKLLLEYEPSADNFLDQLVEGPAGNVVANKPAGFNILLNLLKDSRLFQMVCACLN